MSDKRLIDANALLKEFENRQEQQINKYCDCFLNDAQEISTEWWCVEDLVAAFPTIDAVPFEMFADKCKHANISCVDPDNRVFDRVCLHTRPKGKSWGTCSFETCPIIAKMDGGAEG